LGGRGKLRLPKLKDNLYSAYTDMTPPCVQRTSLQAKIRSAKQENSRPLSKLRSLLRQQKPSSTSLGPILRLVFPIHSLLSSFFRTHPSLFHYVVPYSLLRPSPRPCITFRIMPISYGD